MPWKLLCCLQSSVRSVLKMPAPQKAVWQHEELLVRDSPSLAHAAGCRDDKRQLSLTFQVSCPACPPKQSALCLWRGEMRREGCFLQLGLMKSAISVLLLGYDPITIGIVPSIVQAPEKPALNAGPSTCVPAASPLQLCFLFCPFSPRPSSGGGEQGRCRGHDCGPPAGLGREADQNPD